MENITQFSEIVDVSILIISTAFALIYMNDYFSCHSVILIGVILLILSIVLGALLFGCNPESNSGIYDLYKAEKNCLPIKGLSIFLLSIGLISTGTIGYIKVTLNNGFKQFKNDI